MLAVPLGESQLIATGTMHDQLDDWVAAQRALDKLATTMPSNTELDQVLVKAAVLNQLYGTNLYHLHDMAFHIVEIFSSEADWEDECVLVERIAYPVTSDKFHDSFAAKYCHFFVDSQLFLPYDKHARRTVQMHLGAGKFRCTRGKETYRNFYTDVANLRASLSFNPTVRELDHYLWLRGQWEAFSDEEPIGAEVRRLFEGASRDDDVRRLIDDMCGRRSSEG